MGVISIAQYIENFLYFCDKYRGCAEKKGEYLAIATFTEIISQNIHRICKKKLTSPRFFFLFRGNIDRVCYRQTVVLFSIHCLFIFASGKGILVILFSIYCLFIFFL